MKTTLKEWSIVNFRSALGSPSSWMTLRSHTMKAKSHLTSWNTSRASANSSVDTFMSLESLLARSLGSDVFAGPSFLNEKIGKIIENSIVKLKAKDQLGEGGLWVWVQFWEKDGWVLKTTLDFDI